MDLSVIDTATLQLWHRAALDALQAISTTGQEVAMSYSTPGSSRSGTWSSVDREALTMWIGQLADELAGRNGSLGRRRRFAIGVRF